MQNKKKKIHQKQNLIKAKIKKINQNQKIKNHQSLKIPKKSQKNPKIKNPKRKKNQKSKMKKIYKKL